MNAVVMNWMSSLNCAGIIINIIIIIIIINIIIIIIIIIINFFTVGVKIYSYATANLCLLKQKTKKLKIITKLRIIRLQSTIMTYLKSTV